jgi:hypothetical protein
MITKEEFNSIQNGDVIDYRFAGFSQRRQAVVIRQDSHSVLVRSGETTFTHVYADEIIAVNSTSPQEVKQPEAFKPMIAAVYAHDSAIPSMELKITAQKGFDILVSLLDNPSVCHITLKRDKGVISESTIQCYRELQQ